MAISELAFTVTVDTDKIDNQLNKINKGLNKIRNKNYRVTTKHNKLYEFIKRIEVILLGCKKKKPRKIIV